MESKADIRIPRESTDSRTLTARVAALFRAQPNNWIDGTHLARVGGRYAWRSRVSDCRKSPFSMTIENRQRRVRTSDGQPYTVSEYRFVPPTEERSRSDVGEAARDRRLPL
jgi:hypothetical protein